MHFAEFSKFNRIVQDKLSEQRDAQWDIAMAMKNKESIIIGNGTICKLYCIMEVGSVDKWEGNYSRSTASKTLTEYDLEITIKDLTILGAESNVFKGSETTTKTEIITGIETLIPKQCEEIVVIENDQIYFENNQLNGVNSANIYDLNGRLLISQNFYHYEAINIENLQEGIYVLDVNERECVIKFAKF